MKTRLVGIFVCMLLVVPCLSMTVVADPELEISIYGGFPVIFKMGNVGGAIVNVGDATTHNVSYNVVITGGFQDSINYAFNGTGYNISPGNALGVSTNAIEGFGPVEITIAVSSSDAGSVNETAQGFQIGGFTWVPFGWVRVFLSG